MLWHVVLLKPRPDLSGAERRALVDTFADGVRVMPTIRAVRVGRRVTHGAAYERGAPDSADYLLAIAFDDLAGLQAYLQHPAHDAIGARFGDSLSAALVYDFEVGGIDTLSTLV